MNELDVESQERLAAVTERRRHVLAGALDALALARSNAARSEHALQAEAAGASPEVDATTGADAVKGGWDRRVDATEIVVGDQDHDDATPAPPVRRSGTPGPARIGDDELEGRDWLR